MKQQLAQKHFKLLARVDWIQNSRRMVWNKLDSRHIIIDSTPSRGYLVTLKQSCHHLDAVDTITFSTTTGRVRRADKLLVADAAGGFGERCLIADLHRLKSIGPAATNRERF